jgi:hypothetical protein
VSSAPYRVVPLDAAAHDRSSFASGSAPLDRYLREQVTQDIRRRVAACFGVVVLFRKNGAERADFLLCDKHLRHAGVWHPMLVTKLLIYLGFLEPAAPFFRKRTTTPSTTKRAFLSQAVST